MTTADAESLADAFERRTLDPAAFDHRSHVAVAWVLLGRHPFLEAAALYARTIEAIATAAGAHDKFNLTITLAFLSLIAERRQACSTVTFEAFVEANPDLLDSRVLSRWYSRERLASDGARQTFLLPDAATG